MKKIVFIIFLCLCQVVLAQDKGTIKGLITDKDFSGEPLPNANVYVKNTSIGVTTDFDGNYTLNVPEGQQVIVFSFIGYETVEKNINVVAGETMSINLEMGASEGESLDVIEIVAKVNKEGATALLAEQRKANVIKESIGAEELSQKAVSDAAGAVSKISGISKQEGGSNVYVRGLGDRYLNTTFNGLPLPSNNVDKKNIDLGLFSSDVIQNIGVSKTYSSSFYGDFSAGNVDITPKEHRGKAFLDIELGTKINSNAIGEDFLKSEGTGFFGFYNRFQNDPFAVVLSHGVDPVNTEGPVGVSGSISGGKSWEFGEESRLSFFGTASFGSSYEYVQGQSANVTGVANNIFREAEEFEYSRTTTAMANIAYRINDANTIKFTSLFINDATDVVGRFGTDGTGFNRNTINDSDDFGFFVQNVQFDQDMIFVNQLTGDSNINEKLKVDYGIGFNNVLSRQPDRRRIALENFDLALDDDASTNPIFFNNIDFDNQRYFQSIEDQELNARLNFNYEHNENLSFDFGYNGRIKKRDFENQRFGLGIIENRTAVTDVNDFDAIFNVGNLGTVFNTEVINAIDPANGFGSTNLPGLAENTYSGELDVHAVYASAIYKYGDKWTFIPGLRAESFKQSIEYDVINLVANNPGRNEVSEFFFLPSLNIKYVVNDKQNLRFSVSRTVSNPEFKEVAPFVYEDVTERIGGNPDLLNDPAFSTIINLDLKYEWFFESGQLLSLAAFAKQINDPVNLVSANDATGTQRFFRTGDKAEVFGLELEARKTLLKNEEDGKLLSAGLNVTYTSTKQDLKTVSGTFNTSFNRDSDQLQGASPVLVNTDVSFTPTFNEYKPVVNLVFSYFSDRIDALGAGQLGNIVEKGVSTLDFVWKNKIKDNFEINLSLKNLLNPTIERVRENATVGQNILNTLDIPVTANENGFIDEFALSSYKRGVNIGLQFKYTF